MSFKPQAAKKLAQVYLTKSLKTQGYQKRNSLECFNPSEFCVPS